MTIGDKIKGFTRQQLADACYTGARICDATGCDSQIEPLLSAAAQLIADGERHTSEGDALNRDGNTTKPTIEVPNDAFEHWWYTGHSYAPCYTRFHIYMLREAFNAGRYREQETKP